MRIVRWIESDDHVHSIVELRKSNRYALRVPVLFEWAPQNGEPQSGRGVTRDINTFGVYIMTDALPPVGALVQMDILLPKLEAPGFGMSLACLLYTSDVYKRQALPRVCRPIFRSMCGPLASYSVIGESVA